jgi:hypothetical protein
MASSQSATALDTPQAMQGIEGHTEVEIDVSSPSRDELLVCIVCCACSHLTKNSSAQPGV